MAKQMCVLYPVSNNGVWLGRKKRKIGAGSINGCGGKPEGGESIIEAMIREAYEEWGITIEASDLKLVAILNVSREGIGHEFLIHVFTTERWGGQFIETDEMGLPSHYPISKVPYDHMMPADKLWLKPILTTGLCVEASFTYNHDRTEVQIFIAHTLRI